MLGGGKMALLVSGSKYDELVRENKKITNNLDSVLKVVNQMQEENKKILLLKDRYALNAETLQKENDDLKVMLSIAQQDVFRLQSELSILTEMINSEKDQEMFSNTTYYDKQEEKINLDDDLQVMAAYLTKNISELSTDLLKIVFDEILRKKTNAKIKIEKRKRYLSQLITTLTQILDCVKKENKLVELLILTDDENASRILKEQLFETKLSDIAKLPTSSTVNFDVQNRFEKDVYTKLVQVLRNLHDSVLNDRVF